MWKYLSIGVLSVAWGSLAHAEIIIDDFTVGPALDTMPPYGPQYQESLKIVDNALDSSHVWAGYRAIGVGTYGIPGPGDPLTHALISTSPADGGHMVYYSDLSPARLTFFYSATGDDDSNRPLLVPPLDFSAHAAALRLDINYSLRMGESIRFAISDVHGNGFGQHFVLPELTDPFSLLLTVGPSERYDWTAIEQLWVTFTPGGGGHGSLSIDNIVFVPEPTNCACFVTGCFLLFLLRRRRSL